MQFTDLTPAQQERAYTRYHFMPSELLGKRAIIRDGSYLDGRECLIWNTFGYDWNDASYMLEILVDGREQHGLDLCEEKHLELL